MEFGWSRAGTAAIFTVGSIVYGFGSFPAGALIDRLGPRKLLPLASVTVAAGCLISAAAVEKWHFYIAYGVGQGIGAWAAGAVFDFTGSYDWAVRITIPVYALIGISYWVMAPRKVRRIITPR